MMNKETVLEGLAVKVAEVVQAGEAVSNFVGLMDESVSEGVEAVAQLESLISAKKEALNTFTDMGEARVAKAEINNLVEELELQKAVNVGKRSAMLEELESVIGAFFSAHKGAKFVYSNADDYCLVNTSLSELTDTRDLLQGFANKLAYSFAGVRNILLDEGIVAPENQNKVYKGIHLGQVVRETQLAEFASRVRPFINDLNRAGVAIR